MNDQNRKYDLEERTAIFGEKVIGFTKKIKENSINKPLISQIVRAATSVGANYCEADDAESSKDFLHKLGICKKEAREAKHFFRMIAAANHELRGEARILWQEARELNLIFNAIIIKIRNKNKVRDLENLDIS